MHVNESCAHAAYARSQTQVVSSEPPSSAMLPKELLELLREDAFNASDPSSDGDENGAWEVNEEGDAESGEELYGEEDGEVL